MTIVKGKLKLKLFSAVPFRIEEQVNEWLSGIDCEIVNIEIINSNCTSSPGLLNYFILYREI